MSISCRYQTQGILLLTIVVLLTFGLAGCGMSTGSNAAASSAVTSGSGSSFITGVAHGGRQPISGGTAALWAAGTTTGYGAGATLLQTVTTSTDGNGSFSFSASCTTGQLLYITVTGGSPDSGSGTNSYAALMAAIPNGCNTTATATSSQFVVVNEATTVAAVWSLRNFMSVTPANVSTFAATPTAANAPWMIGAPSTNTTGLTIAFEKVGSLINLIGYSGTSQVYNTVNYGGSNTVTYNTTVSPEAGHLYPVANILSDCVNSVDTTDNSSHTGSTLCTNLAGDVSTVIGGTGTGPTPPQDTIQMAFYIAMAPGGIFVNAVNGATQGAQLANVGGAALSTNTAPATNQWPSKLCTNYVTASPAYSMTVGTTTWVCGMGTAASVADFQINTRWSAVDTTTHAYTYGLKAAPGAVDANGNVWTVNFQTGVSSPGQPVVEWDPTGRILQVVGGYNAVSGTAATVSYPTSTLNVFVTSNASPGTPSTTATTFTTAQSNVALPAYIEGYTTAASTIPFDIAVDTKGNAWFTDIVGAAAANSASNPNPAGTPASATSAPIQTLTNGAASFNTGLLVETGPATSVSTCLIPCASGSGTSTAGAVTGYATGAYPVSLAIDGANNIWVGTRPYATAVNSGNGYMMLMTAASNYTNIYMGQSASSNPLFQIVVDGINHYAWWTASTTTNGKPIYRNSLSNVINNGGSSTTTTAQNILGTNYNCTAPCTTGLVPRWITVDKYGNPWVGEQTSNEGYLAYINLAAAGSLTPPLADVNFVPSSINTSGSTAVNTPGGLDAPIALSIDGANNVWVGADLTSTDGGVSVFLNTGAASTTPGSYVALSPDNDTTYSFGYDAWNMDAPRAMEIDSAGNVYLGSGSNSYYGTMVGAAVPVVTPRATNTGLGQTATITAWSIDGTGTNATFTTTNPPALNNNTVILYGFSGADAFLNNQVVTVTASTAGTSFSATVTGGSSSYTGAGGGSASYIPLNNGTIGSKP